MPAVRRSEIRFAEKDEALRDDVHQLGELVGELVRDQCGEGLFDLVESARRASIDRREGVEAAESRLSALVDGLAAQPARDVTRAFSTYFQMVNTAERVHRIRRRREYLIDPTATQPRSFADTLTRLKNSGCSAEDIAGALGKLRLEPVFTPHPTAPTRRSILRKQQNIVRRLVEMLDTTLTPPERATARARIRTEMTSGWQTEEHPAEGMTVADDLEYVLFFLTDVLYHMIPPFYEGLELALEEVYGDAAAGIEVPEFIRFASWVGGDLEGNPDITAKTIRQAMSRQRALILNLYYEECAALATKLSQCASRVNVSTELKERIRVYSGHLPHAQHEVPPRHRDMPYRVFLRLVMARLQATFEDTAFAYESAGEFIDDIDTVGRSLLDNKGRHAGYFAVRRLLRRARTFGFHLLTLDIRQHAAVHRQVIGEGLGEQHWERWSAHERAARISEALDARISPAGEISVTARRTLAVFQTIAFCRRKFGHESIGAYLVSMSENPEDVLGVLLLARWGDLGSRDGRVPLDVAPLFETVDALRRAPEVMTELFRHPTYRRHLSQQNDEQLVMVGYADSNEDSGLAWARWSLYRAQAALLREIQWPDIHMTLFHGRAGSVSRGGGKTHAAVLASPSGAVRNRLRIAEPGEAINTKYGLRAISMRTLEQTWSALMTTTLRPEPPEKADGIRAAVMEAVAGASRERYHHLVYGHGHFADYFRAATPVDVLARLNIGFRPPAPSQGTDMSNLQSGPWVFAWSQCRCLLPGWFGIGTGLSAAMDQFGEDQVRSVVRDWPFLRTLIADVETVLAKADMDIARRYSELSDDLHDRFFPIVRQEYKLAVSVVLRLLQQEDLLEMHPLLRRAIMLRNPYADPLSFLQVELLRRWRAADRRDEALLQALVASVNGIAHAMQNTA